MPKYTVKAVMPTGKSSQTFGTEYYIQFNETENSFQLWFKTQPEIGQEIEGDISGNKFKKVKKEWKPQDQAPATTSGPQTKTSSYRRTDNSDGQRQGMCLNNAAAYINTLEFPKALTNREWAELVHDYATSLYVLGDLKQSEVTAETVAGVFGGN